MAKQITIEIVTEYEGLDGFYYADLVLPAEDYAIRDALQKARAVLRQDGYQEISILNCDLLPGLSNVRLDSPTLDEMNFFAKRLDSLNDEERLALQAVAPRIMPEHPEGELVSMKDFINMTYRLDTVMIASNVGNDEQLGQFVVENDLHEDVVSVPDNALYLLDRKQIGKLQRENDGGVFINGFYVIAGDYEMPEVYDGKNLPHEEASHWFAFRLEVAEAPVNSADETAGSAEWISLPTKKEKADEIAKQHNEACIEDCVYYGFESSVPQITSEMFGDMADFDTLNTLAQHMAELSPLDQVKFKAVLSANPPKDVQVALDMLKQLGRYELSYDSDSAGVFFKDYLRHFMDNRFDSRWLDTLLTQNEGERLLQKLGAAETPYGVISACGRSLYEIVPFDEPETKELKTQTLTNEKLDVIEVLYRRALFSNGRLIPEEIPEGLYAYDLRHSDDGSRFISIEPKVGVNHGGTVLMKEVLDFGESGYIPFEEDTDPNFTGLSMTPQEFADEELEENQDFEGMVM